MEVSLGRVTVIEDAFLAEVDAEVSVAVSAVPPRFLLSEAHIALHQLHWSPVVELVRDCQVLNISDLGCLLILTLCRREVAER